MHGTKVKTLSIPQAAIHQFAWLTLFAIALYILSITAAFAITTPMGNVLCTVVYMLYGNLGRAIATIAIIIIGVGASLGKVSWGLAMTVGVGIAVFANASYIVLILTGVNGC